MMLFRFWALLVCSTAMTLTMGAPVNDLTDKGKREEDVWFVIGGVYWISYAPYKLKIKVDLFTGGSPVIPYPIEVPYDIRAVDDLAVSLGWGTITLNVGETQGFSDVITVYGDLSSKYLLTYTDPLTNSNIIVEVGCTGLGQGDPHLKTFDGYRYNFNGYCSYVLMKTCDGTFPPFQITADFRGKDPEHPYDPPTRMVSFNVTTPGRQMVRINADDSVLIDGKTMVTFKELIGDNEGYVTRKDGSYITVNMVHPPIYLTWNRRARSSIIIGFNDDRAMNGTVCGLLGNADGSPHNDFVKPDGKRTFNSNDFGQSWEVPGSCP